MWVQMLRVWGFRHSGAYSHRVFDACIDAALRHQEVGLLVPEPAVSLKPSGTTGLRCGISRNYGSM